MNIEQRIAQWENMTQADPENDMGWFSLGNAYIEADRFEDAQAALAKCIDLNQAMSKAYQLRAKTLIDLDRKDEAAELLTKGFLSAAERGDMLPRNAMADMLKALDKPIPEVEEKELPPEVVSGEAVIDRRTGRVGQKLPDPPMRGDLGAFIYAHYSMDTWREWIGMGTKVINELRLDFSNPDHQKVYDQHMCEWLGISDEDVKHFAAENAG